jgi:hypothetical protein
MATARPHRGRGRLRRTKFSDSPIPARLSRLFLAPGGQIALSHGQDPFETFCALPTVHCKIDVEQRKRTSTAQSDASPIVWRGWSAVPPKTDADWDKRATCGSSADAEKVKVSRLNGLRKTAPRCSVDGTAAISAKLVEPFGDSLCHQQQARPLLCCAVRRQCRLLRGHSLQPTTSSASTIRTSPDPFRIITGLRSHSSMTPQQVAASCDRDVTSRANGMMSVCGIRPR